MPGLRQVDVMDAKQIALRGAMLLSIIFDLVLYGSILWAHYDDAGPVLLALIGGHLLVLAELIRHV